MIIKYMDLLGQNMPLYLYILYRPLSFLIIV